MADRLTLEQWTRVRSFLFDLTDPEMFGFAVTSEVRQQALILLAMFNDPDRTIPAAGQAVVEVENNLV